MSKQVEVTKEMADVLDRLNFNIDKTVYVGGEATLLDGLAVGIVTSTNYKPFDFLKRNNITLENLVNIYQYGYKRKYEFKEKDVVICETTGAIYQLPTKLVSVSAANNLERFKLVCKAENREDSK
ncbi:hypothetical protein [Alkalihalophilus marmarensis]|uniref:hypothetical protein n=1 Tax=Alkalihalophilus marmarensis TaxID=521377 RepID=UPI002E216753|nr:hypothetical protein [Alkalihalophilus marmarensis]